MLKSSNSTQALQYQTSKHLSQASEIYANQSPYATPPHYTTLPRKHSSSSASSNGGGSSKSLAYQVSPNNLSKPPSARHAFDTTGKTSGVHKTTTGICSLSPSLSVPNLGESNYLSLVPNHGENSPQKCNDPSGSRRPYLLTVSPVHRPQSLKSPIYQYPVCLSGSPDKGNTNIREHASPHKRAYSNENLYANHHVSSKNYSLSLKEASSRPESSNGDSNKPLASCDSSYHSSVPNSPSHQTGNMSSASGSCWSTNDVVDCGGSSNSNDSSSTPVRDSASIKQVRYGPGHEKYPSWPIPATSAEQVDPTGKVVSTSGSSRSKSWTESTDYPKEKVPSYARPYMKRMNQAFTQQLKTVMEKCERIPVDAYDPKKSVGGSELKKKGYNNSNLSSGTPPTSYRDMYNNSNSSSGRMYNSKNSTASVDSGNGCHKDYDIPSPPERDTRDKEMVKPLTQEDLELYAKKYEEMRSQYAQSEGYHSYISSECSSYIGSGTPFLDQLRRESESNTQFWAGDMFDPNDPLYSSVIGALAPSGRESVTTVVTNSSSNSSGTETLKWHGSNSDVSSNMSHPLSTSSSNNQSSWETNSTASSSGNNSQQSNKLPLPQKLHPETILLHHLHQQYQLQQRALNGKDRLQKSGKHGLDASIGNENVSNGAGGQNLKKFPLSTYTRPDNLGLPGSKRHAALEKIQQVLSPEKIAEFLKESNKKSKAQSPIIDTSKPPSVAERILELEQQSLNKSSTNSSPARGKSSSNLATAVNSSPMSAPADKFVKSSSLNNIREKCQSLSTPGSKDFSSSRSNASGVSSSSNGSIDLSPKKGDNYHSLWNGFTQDPSNSTSGEGNNNKSAPTINRSASLENNSTSLPPMGNGPGISYSYLDPDKKHRVADMTLKAIQKKALLSYYERHTGKSSGSCSSSVSSDSSSSSTPSPKNCAMTKSLSATGSNGPSNSSGHATDASTGGSHNSTLLDKDSPFPSSRLTLSLPRDMKEVPSPNGRPDLSTTNKIDESSAATENCVPAPPPKSKDVGKNATSCSSLHGGDGTTSKQNQYHMSSRAAHLDKNQVCATVFSTVFVGA